MRREFTYVDDVTEALARQIDHVPQGNPQWSGAAPDPGSSAAPWTHLQYRQPQAGGVDAGRCDPRAVVVAQGQKTVAVDAAR
jgi:hypothetical protein